MILFGFISGFMILGTALVFVILYILVLILQVVYRRRHRDRRIRVSGAIGGL